MKVKDFKLGATGNFPRGKADAHDEGEIRLAMAADRANGIVRIDFGTPVAWIGLPVKEAREFAALLLKKATEVETGKA